MSGVLTVRRAASEELHPLRSRVLGEDRVGLHATLRGDHHPDSRHWAALCDGEVVGCVSVLPLRGWALRGMAVAPGHQRQGIGSCLMRRVFACVEVAMWCNARHEAVPFYRHHGWAVTSEPFLITGEGQHVRMEWSPLA